MKAALRVFGLPAARNASFVAGGVFGVAILAGAVRILPLLLTPGVPADVAWPLARGVAGVALETALFVAPPLGWALAAAKLVDRGEARALFALGVRPWSIVVSAWPAAVLLAALAAVAAASWGREAAAPGRLARQLVADARAGCQDEAVATAAPAAVDVPLVGVSWVCLPGEAPRAVGKPSFGGGRAAFAATALELADDLRAVSFRDLTVVTPLSGSDQPARFRFAQAEVRGLPPLGRASNLGVFARTALLALSALALAVASATFVLRASIASRARAGALAVLAAGASLLVFSALERSSVSSALYLAVPAVGLFSLLAVAVARHGALVARTRAG
ncbi:MAG: hypothetical protein WKG00_18520 [Polyangiaceae bacterium]